MTDELDGIVLFVVVAPAARDKIAQAERPGPDVVARTGVVVAVLAVQDLVHAVAARVIVREAIHDLPATVVVNLENKTYASGSVALA